MSVNDIYIYSILTYRYVIVFLLYQGRGNERRIWFAAGRLRGGGKARQSDAQLGRLQRGESVERGEAWLNPASLRF